MYVEILNTPGLAELRLAFDMAANELRLGTSAKDIERRESLAKLMLEFAQEGERDTVVIRTRAVDEMRQPR
jgi:hypothetical protein